MRDSKVWGVAAAIAAAVLGTACAPVSGNGNVVERSFERTGFEEVAVSHGLHAVVQTGPQAAVTLRGDENLLDEIELTVEGGVLRTVVPPGVSLWPTTPITLTVTLPVLRGVSASGGSEVTARGVNASPFTVSASGGSTVRASGEAGALEAEVSGGSQVFLDAIAARTLDVHASGGSDVHAQVSERVTGGLSGGSSLSLQGQADASWVDQSGGSSIHRN